MIEKDKKLTQKHTKEPTNWQNWQICREAWLLDTPTKSVLGIIMLFDFFSK